MSEAPAGEVTDLLQQLIRNECVNDGQAESGNEWRSADVVATIYPSARLLPRLMVGSTDARFFRARGAVAYGFGLYSRDITYEDLSTRFHGVDERVDVDSLRLTTDALLRICREFLS